ncbi:MAG: hypothetical protein AAF405_04940 [Pseudomonadota bacterium]
MRARLLTIGFVLIGLIIGSAAASAQEVRCSAIRDSAQCVSDSRCWYDAANNKGCLDGPAPANDRCAVHGSTSICNASSFGCSWNADAGKCVSKAP